MALIKVPIWRRIFVLSFYGNVGHIVSYVTKVTMKNEDKKASKMGVLINAMPLKPSCTKQGLLRDEAFIKIPI